MKAIVYAYLVKLHSATPDSTLQAPSVKCPERYLSETLLLNLD